MKFINKADDRIREYRERKAMKIIEATPVLRLEAVEKPENFESYNYIKLPFSRLLAYGAAFEPLTTEFQRAASGCGGSGFYYVDTKGLKMFQKNGTGKFIGSLRNKAGTVGGGQAEMSAFFNPTMLFVAASLAQIDKKLDDIKAMQTEMMNFLKQKEKSELIGSLNFLSDTLDNYKYNCNNELYKKNNHIKALDIRQEAEKEIVFYKEQILSVIGKKSFVHSDATADKYLSELKEKFEYYRLSLYLMAFSSFLEVLLLENYDEKYLNGISEKLDSFSSEYRELYKKCYKEAEAYFSTTLQSSILKGLEKASKTAGKFVEKLPFLGDTQADENLIAAGEKLNEFNNRVQKKKMISLTDEQNSMITPFIENINAISALYNKHVKILADNENLYIEPNEE